MNAPYAIEPSGLTKSFGERVAVENVDLLPVPRGAGSGGGLA
jgi:hypothetical protein